MKKKRPDSLLLAVVSSLFFFSTSAYAGKADKIIEQIEEEERKEDVEHIVRPRLEYNVQETARDPFSSPFDKGEADAGQSAEALRISGEKNLPALSVQGLIWGGNLTQAIINNKVVKAGDEIEGVRIVDINKSGIVVFFEGRQFTLPAPGLGAASLKKPQGG